MDAERGNLIERHLCAGGQSVGAAMVADKSCLARLLASLRLEGDEDGVVSSSVTESSR